MRKVIKDVSGKVLGSWTAKTARGFTIKQWQEINAIRKASGLVKHQD